jgi:hypothetical protein
MHYVVTPTLRWRFRILPETESVQDVAQPKEACHDLRYDERSNQ